jgi:hypothetical protein
VLATSHRQIKLVLRAKFTAATTSPAFAHRTTAAGRRSIMAL